MEVKEVQQKQLELEDKIQTLIKEFKTETGVRVSKIHIYTVQSFMQEHDSYVSIDLDISLPVKFHFQQVG
jgi:hypothetical protein